MKDGANLLENINEFSAIVNQLQKVDGKMEDADLTFLPLVSLPASYDNLVTNLLYGKDMVSLDDVQSCLLSHNIKKKHNQRDEQ